MEHIINYISRVGTAISVLLNVLFGGASNQTLSARNYALKRRGKPNVVWLIDKIFFWDHDHCMYSWLYWVVRKDVIYEMERENGKQEGWQVEWIYLAGYPSER